MNKSKLFGSTLSKPVPLGSLFLICLFAALITVFLGNWIKDLQQQARTKELWRWVGVCRRVSTGERLALIELAGILASGNKDSMVRREACRTIEGLNPNAPSTEMAIQIVASFDQLQFDTKHQKFVLTKNITATATTQASP